MIFDCKSFLNDYGITTREYGKNCQQGWIQVCCPKCSDSGFHGGFNIAGGYYNCWRCGHHSIPSIIRSMINISESQSHSIVKLYSTIKQIEKRNESRIIPRKIDWPEFTLPIAEIHANYLKNRNFNPDKIVKQWSIRGTTYFGDYAYRIIIPIFFNHKMVSYQGRDITNKSSARYKTCEKSKEIINHKSILYGIDHVTSCCFVVEGITDVWRLGKGNAVATFGIEYTSEQVNMLNARLDEVFILFDPEAEKNSGKLAADLTAVGLKATVLDINGSSDPGEFTVDEVNSIVKTYLHH